MIIPQANQPVPDTKLKSEETEAEVPSDPPPDYSQVESSRDTTESLPDLKPCNYTYLSRQNQSISGKWIIQPALHIPSALLPPLQPNETEETRRNISLASQNGSIDADIYVLPSQIETQRRNRVFVETSSRNGSVTTKVHDVPSTDPSKVRLPLAILSSSANGRVKLYLPRSFRGPMTISRTNGSIYLSKTVQSHVTQFSDMNHTQRSFLGHFDPADWEHDAQWAGDELTIEGKNGSIYVSFIDEAEASAAAKTSGFFSRIFTF